MYAQVTHRSVIPVTFDVRYQPARPFDIGEGEHPECINVHTTDGPYLSMSLDEARRLCDALDRVLGAVVAEAI